MKRNYIRIHRNILASWVFADPQSLYVLLYLILQADPETGQVRASQNEISNYLRMPRRTLRRVLERLEDKASIKVKNVANTITIITICNYARYQNLETNAWPTQCTDLKESKEKEKKNLPPHPLIEEKKEEKKESLAGADNFSCEKLTPSTCATREKEKAFEDKRNYFWQQCATRIQRYGYEMVEQFFRYWTETSIQEPNVMRFEKQPTFDIFHRLAKWKTKSNQFGEDRAAHRRKQNATTQYTTLNAKETATMESLIDHQQQREAQWKERSRKAVTYEEYQRMKAEGKIK